MKRMFAFVLSIFLALTQNIIVFAATDINICAKSAILIDAKSGEIIYEKNSHEKLPPASVTKIMTMLLIMEAIDSKRVKLDDKVTISEKASSMGGSQLFMEPGEVKEVQELLKGIAVASANDGCVAMSEYIYGSEEAFVKKMNERAKQLGMKDTNFVNTNGLPVQNHYTSAYDISVMSRELLKHEGVKKYLTTWMDEISVGKKKDKKIGLVNTNKLIRFYQGANGIKTGFTNEAKFCLSASASRNDLSLIAVVLGCPTSKERFNDASTLLNYGFANYQNHKIYDKGTVVDKIGLDKSEEKNVNLICKDNVSILTKKGEEREFEKKIVIYKDFKYPVKKGDKLGEVQIYQNKKLILKSDLVSDKEIKKAGYLKMLQKTLEGII